MAYIINENLFLDSNDEFNEQVQEYTNVINSTIYYHRDLQDNLNFTLNRFIQHAVKPLPLGGGYKALS